MCQVLNTESSKQTRYGDPWDTYAPAVSRIVFWTILIGEKDTCLLRCVTSVCASLILKASSDELARHTFCRDLVVLMRTPFKKTSYTTPPMAFVYA